MPRTLGTLFATIAQWTREGRLSTCSVRASYLELYNEQINDLLNPESTNLQLRAHAQTGVFVENLLQASRPVMWDVQCANVPCGALWDACTVRPESM